MSPRCYLDPKVNQCVAPLPFALQLASDPRDAHYLTPITNISILLRQSARVQTTGLFWLNEVFSTIGTPVSSRRPYGLILHRNSSHRWMKKWLRPPI